MCDMPVRLTSIAVVTSVDGSFQLLHLRELGQHLYKTRGEQSDNTQLGQHLYKTRGEQSDNTQLGQHLYKTRGEQSDNIDQQTLL